MKKDQRGVTLIELVITIAVIGAMLLVIGRFITAGSSGFRDVSANTSLQMGEQDLTEKLQGFLIDCNGCLNLFSDGVIDTTMGTAGLTEDTADKKQLDIYRIQDGKDAKTGKFQKTGICDSIYWERNSARITCVRKVTPLEKGSGSGTEEIVGAEEVLASHVTQFQVDLSKTEEQQIVKFSFTLEEEGRERTAQKNVSLRNHVVVNQEESPYGSDGGKEKMSITLLPHSAIPSGTTVQLEYVLTGTGTSMEVEWAILSAEEGVKASVLDVDGKLKASGSGTVTVKVTALGDTADPKASDTRAFEIYEDSKG